jgi:hypothetical protein
MTRYIGILFFLFPIISLGQPFVFKEVRARYVAINQTPYYDIHAVLIAEKKSDKLSIDSLQLDGVTASGFHLSVLAKSVNNQIFEKGDSVLVKATVASADTAILKGIAIYYHLNSNRAKKKYIKTSAIKRLEPVYFYDKH